MNRLIRFITRLYWKFRTRHTNVWWTANGKIPPDSIVGAWNFTGTSGNFLTDLSGNGHDLEAWEECNLCGMPYPKSKGHVCIILVSNECLSDDEVVKIHKALMKRLEAKG